jgi:hypothetical protein
MNTNKKEVENLLYEVNQIISNQNQIKQLDLEAQLEEKYEPLIKQANDIKTEIEIQIHSKYQNELSAILKRKSELNQMLDILKIEEAKTFWYPEGSVVYLWEHSGGWNSKLEKTSQTGTVTIYDGTQELSDTVHRANKPKKGDIIVLYNKKDGSIGKKFDKITEYGSFCHSVRWFSEEHTPQNNLITEKEKLEQEEEEQ